MPWYGKLWSTPSMCVRSPKGPQDDQLAPILMHSFFLSPSPSFKQSLLSFVFKGLLFFNKVLHSSPPPPSPLAPSTLLITTMATPTQDWTSEQLLSDAISKKDIVTFLHVNATHDFLVEHKLTGKLVTVVKNGMFSLFLFKSISLLYLPGGAPPPCTLMVCAISFSW